MTAPDSRPDHRARLNRVLDYIEQHLGEPLDLSRLAAIASFSPWHFHRIFTALTGETLADHVRRRRLERAALKLIHDPQRACLAIALDVGFGSAEVFSRQFRQHFAMSPTQWRRGGWRNWQATRQDELSKIGQAVRKPRHALIQLFGDDPVTWPTTRQDEMGDEIMHVELRTLPASRVAYLRYTGPYAGLGIANAWKLFAEWCAGQGFTTPRRPMFGVSLDNPNVTAPDQCRYDCCVEVDETFRPQGEIGVETLPGGRYACTRFTGVPADMPPVWQRLYNDWLPESGLRFDNRPAFEFYDTDFTYDPVTGAFSCWLCIPVKSL